MITEKNAIPNVIQADKLVLAIFIISRRFALLFKWSFSGLCFLTTYDMQLANNKKQ